MMMMLILPQLDSYKAEILMEILTQYIWSFHSSERPKWEEILKNLEILGELRLCHHHTIKVLRYANWNMWFQKALCKLFIFFPIINDHEAPTHAELWQLTFLLRPGPMRGTPWRQRCAFSGSRSGTASGSPHTRPIGVACPG